MSSTTTKNFKLNNGVEMPAVGVGCWMGAVGEGDHVTQMVKTALELGYRHVDTAANYGDEESVGKALKETNVPRGEIFLTTKVDQKDHGSVKEAMATSLRKLGVSYVDLYLMHWPMAFDASGGTLQPEESPTFVETWVAMEKLLADGATKAIGVSNFSIKTLETLLAHPSVSIVPAVNQVELHPALPQHDLLAFCTSRGILLMGYAPVGKNKYAAGDTTIAAIARAHSSSVTGAQVLLSWGVQRGTAVIPKSVHEERLRENLQLVELSEEEMATLDAFHMKPGMHHSVCGFHSPDLGGSCFGWTYDQLGWDVVIGGIH
ncbi:Aldo/keto reductase, partial [Schizopora paradoxa]